MSSERFGDSAARLCAATAALLGWRPSEFWEATPAELALILNRPGDEASPPDMATIETLRRLFPDG
jgi:uncharacterized phage protein (TIGR02216 family)